MATYRVWFADGSNLLTDATNEMRAIDRACAVAKENGDDDPVIVKVERSQLTAAERAANDRD